MLSLKALNNRVKPRPSVGFTLVDLLVATGILVVLLTLVLANFRTAQNSSELDIVLKQIISDITNVRNMSLGGQRLTTGFWPLVGYGIHFDLTLPDQYILYFTSDVINLYSAGNELSNGKKKIKKNIFTKFYGLTRDGLTADGEVVKKPGEGSWQDLSAIGINILNVVFPLSGGVITDVKGSGGVSFEYVGGKIKNLKTNKEAYFYISLTSGIVVGELYDKK